MQMQIAFIFQFELKSFKEAEKYKYWIEAIQEKLHQFGRKLKI